MTLSKMEIDKNSSLPLYYQLKELIKRDIENGTCKPGDSILSEREMMEYYSISRTPIRQALNELVSEGYLRREHGKGTFVAEKKISQLFLESLTSFDVEMADQGLSYRTKLIRKQIVEATPTLEGIFGPDHDRFYYFERLRYVQNNPYVFVITYVPCSIAPILFDMDLETNSLYNILKKTYGLEISHAKRDIEAINIDDNYSEILGIQPNAAIHLTTSVAFLENNQPFEYSIGRYRGDLNKFSVNVSFKNNDK